MAGKLRVVLLSLTVIFGSLFDPVFGAVEETPSNGEAAKVELDKHVEEQTNISTITSPFRSCSDARITSSGRYWIQPFVGEEPFEAYCENEKFGGGWHVIQNRFDGSVDFYRGWQEFKTGFGDLNGEFFVGLQTVHQLTTAKKHMLAVEVETFDGRYGYARYDKFKLGSEDEQFELKELGRYTGTAEDSMSWYHKGMKFTTKDRDHDTRPDGNCAYDRHGAWWHENCGTSNLNGAYGISPFTRHSNYWYHFTQDLVALKTTRMMIKEA